MNHSLRNADTVYIFLLFNNCVYGIELCGTKGLAVHVPSFLRSSWRGTIILWNIWRGHITVCDATHTSTPHFLTVSEHLWLQSCVLFYTISQCANTFLSKELCIPRPYPGYCFGKDIQFTACLLYTSRCV